MNNKTDSFSQKDNTVSKQIKDIDGVLYSVSEFVQEIEKLDEEIFTEKCKIREKENELNLKKTFLREELIKQTFNEFILQKSEMVQKAVYLNMGLLRFVVKSYFDDIYRYKDYSGTKLANQHKQAAYTIKWIVKFKPIQIKEEYDNENLDNVIMDINLIFALLCGFSFLSEKSLSLIAKEKENKEKMEKDQSFYDKLLYTLRYRPFSGKQLISIFEALELSAEFSRAPTHDNSQSI